ncbi:MAG: YggS family pyridoxal phosphate-dependent enzyme [Pontimonas sp.]|nr:YggS family pyridoxal phosphate-dependent enzyme [Pontimonas sp.]
MGDSLEARVHEVQERIAAAARAAGREESEITTIVVTKFHPAELVRELYALGIRHVGENRHQEAVAKHAELAELDLTWHFIGQLQSNKARAVAEYAQVIHSVDRPSLVEALARQDREVDVFLEINLTDVPGRGGVLPAELEALCEAVLQVPVLNLRGVMAVAPVDEEPSRAFERVLGYAERVRSLAPEARELSIGMSGDFEAAIALGATHLRIGTAITGKRPAGA